MITSMPTPPSSPADTLFAFHQAKGNQSRPKSHYRTFSSANPSIYSSLDSRPMIPSVSPKKSIISSKFKKSARHLKLLFSESAPPPLSLPYLPTPITSSVSLPSHSSFALVTPPSSAESLTPRSSSSVHRPRLPFDNHKDKDEYTPLPVIRRAGCLLHPYGTKASYVDSYLHAAETERYDLILLQRINENGSPTFHPIESPPKDILDLGAGACHWAVYAARYWKESSIVAFDMVDVRAPSLPAPSNLKFIRGNFVRYKLPFSDESFDLIRMSNLAPAISTAQWDHVLAECHRVLTVGGRLEIIHDQTNFSYADEPTPAMDFLSVKSQRDSFSSSETAADSVEPYSDSDTLITELDVLEEKIGVPSLSEGIPPLTDSDIPPLLSEPEIEVSPRSKVSSNIVPAVEKPLPSLPTWQQHYETSKWLEDCYVKMLADMHDICINDLDPVQPRLEKIFSAENVPEASVYNIHLASPEIAASLPTAFLTIADVGKSTKRSQQSFDDQISSKLGVSPQHLPTTPSLPACPGIIVDITTSLSDPIFMPMSALELEYHACHHLHELLGSKNALHTYFMELRDEHGEPMMTDSEFKDIIFDYEVFRRERFRWPSTLPELSFDFDDEDESTKVPDRSSQDLSMPISRESSTASIIFNNTLTPMLHPVNQLPHIRTIEVYQAWKRPHNEADFCL